MYLSAMAMSTRHGISNIILALGVRGERTGSIDTLTTSSFGTLQPFLLLHDSGDEVVVDGFDSYNIADLQRDQRHNSEVEKGLLRRARLRAWMQESGHHFGGYHYWKNNRHGPSIRYMNGTDPTTYDAILPLR